MRSRSVSPLLLALLLLTSLAVFAQAVPVPTPLPAPVPHAGHVPSAPPGLVTLIATVVYLALAWWASICVTYAMMFLGKSVLRAASGGLVPAGAPVAVATHYKKLLRPMLCFLTVLAGGLGYWSGGAPAALALGIGAASSGILHDLIDGVRALKGKVTS